MSIGDLARKLDVTIPTIRHWEKEFHIRPRRTQGGHRRYFPKEQNQLRLICHLLRTQGHTIEGARKAYRELQQWAA